jgi:hypothetical protein
MVLLVSIIFSAFKPVVRFPPCVRNGDDLDMLAGHAIDDEERESAKQKGAGAAHVRRRGLGALSDQLHGSI